MALGAASELTALSIGLVRNGATIDDIHVRGLGERNEHMPFGLEPVFNCGSVVLVDLTT